MLNPTPENHRPPRIEIKLLGHFSLRVHGQEVTGLSRPVTWMAALLALHQKNGISRPRLASTLWPDATSDRADFYLRRSLMELRRALGSERERLITPPRSLVRIDLLDGFCDFTALQDYVAGKLKEPSVEQLTALYHGDFLPDCDAEWALIERDRLRSLFLDALEKQAEYLESQGLNLTEAVGILRRIVLTDPLRETAHRKLMQLLGQLGDYAGVERQYQQLRLLLHDQLHVTPSAETTALYRDLGQRGRQAQITKPLCIPSLEATTNNLPHPLTVLVGREEERRSLQRAVAVSRLVTLVGPGGVGKTRLALFSAEAMSSEFSAGVCFVDLSAARSEDNALQAITMALNLHPEPNLKLLESVCRHLSLRRLLLVLDNAEQIVLECAHLAKALLNRCPHVTILCTSRQPLRIAGETIFSVQPLPVPQESSGSHPQSADEFMRCPSVALLVDRVTSGSPSFRIEASNALAIAALCRRLDGLPLALELVAPLFRSLKPNEILRRLDDRFRQLNNITNPPRHRTLQATLDWSYDLLTSDEQSLLRDLSVFRGGWTLESRDGTHPDRVDTFLLLSNLVDKSLVVYEEHAGKERYRLLEMTRQYAAEKMGGSETLKMKQRHAEYFLGLAQKAEETGRHLQAPIQYDSLLPDRDNFRACWDWYQDREPIVALWLECFLCGVHVWEAGNSAQFIKRVATTSTPETTVGMQILYWASEWALWTRHPAREELLHRLLRDATRSNRPDFQFGALNFLVCLEDERGNFDRSLEYTEECLRIVTPEHGDDLISAYRSKLAVCLIRSGQASRGISLLKTQLAELRERGAWQSVCQVSLNLGEALLEIKEYGDALDCLKEATPIATVESPLSVTYFWRYRSRSAVGLADYAEAWHCLDQSLLVSVQNRQKDREGWTRFDMASLAAKEQRQDEAEHQIRESIIAFRENNEDLSMTYCLIKLAEFCVMWGQFDRAAFILGSAERALKELGVEIQPREMAQLAELHDKIGLLQNEKDRSKKWNRGQQVTLDQAVALVLQFSPEHFDLLAK